MSDTGIELAGQARDSLQVRMKTTLEQSPLRLGVLEERHYSGSRVGDDFLRSVKKVIGADPVSSNILNVYPAEACTSWEDYQELCRGVITLLAPISQEPGVLSELTQPHPEYDSEDTAAPGDLHLGIIDFIENPLPAFFSLTTVVVHPSEDIATRFVQQADETAAIDAYEFTIEAHELPFALPPAPQPAKPDITKAPSRPGLRNVARKIANLLLRFAGPQEEPDAS